MEEKQAQMITDSTPHVVMFIRCFTNCSPFLHTQALLFFGGGGVAAEDLKFVWPKHMVSVKVQVEITFVIVGLRPFSYTKATGWDVDSIWWQWCGYGDPKMTSWLHVSSVIQGRGLQTLRSNGLLLPSAEQRKNCLKPQMLPSLLKKR